MVFYVEVTPCLPYYHTLSKTIEAQPYMCPYVNWITIVKSDGWSPD